MNDTFLMARTLFNIGELREEVWVLYLAEELARNRTRNNIGRYDLSIFK